MPRITTPKTAHTRNLVAGRGPTGEHVVRKGGAIIATFHDRDEGGKPLPAAENARLYAAAPELFGVAVKALHIARVMLRAKPDSAGVKALEAECRAAVDDATPAAVSAAIGKDEGPN